MRGIVETTRSVPNPFCVVGALAAGVLDDQKYDESVCDHDFVAMGAGLAAARASASALALARDFSSQASRVLWSTGQASMFAMVGY